MGLEEDELGNALIPEDLPSAGMEPKKSTKLCKPDQTETAFLMLYHWHWWIVNRMQRSCD